MVPLCSPNINSHRAAVNRNVLKSDRAARGTIQERRLRWGEAPSQDAALLF
jgi:hypothetical protein